LADTKSITGSKCNAINLLLAKVGSSLLFKIMSIQIIKKQILISGYFWIVDLFFYCLNLLPSIFRFPIYKLTLQSIGSGCLIDSGVYIRYPWKFSIGNNSTINRKCSFYGSALFKDCQIKIGNNVAIGPECIFFAAGHDYLRINLPDTASSIIIEDNVWVGGRSIILPGVTISEGAVVGAGSVVTKNVPSWSVVVGNPARIIKKREIDSI
jgi:acetyltransferase-like isoleucine patch superfamily enzyme